MHRRRHRNIHTHTHTHKWTVGLPFDSLVCHPSCCVRGSKVFCVPFALCRGYTHSASIRRHAPTPDNFTLAAIAGGDNHIKPPCWGAFNAASVPLRTWHPAGCASACWRYNGAGCVFPFFLSSFFFPLLLSYRTGVFLCRRYLFSDGFTIACQWAKFELAESDASAGLVLKTTRNSSEIHTQFIFSLFELGR